MKSQKIIPFRIFIILLGISAVFSSFTPNKGGEGFEIYLNNKLVAQRFGNNMNVVTNIELSTVKGNDLLKVRYFHCGKAGKNRSILIKSGQTILKEWKFEDASQPATFMSLKVKEIFPLQKKGNGILYLYYSSSELTDSRVLAKISLDNRDMTSK